MAARNAIDQYNWSTAIEIMRNPRTGPEGALMMRLGTATWVSVAPRTAVRTMTRCWLPGPREIPGSVGWGLRFIVELSPVGSNLPPIQSSYFQALGVPGSLVHLVCSFYIVRSEFLVPWPAWLYSDLSYLHCLRLHHRSLTIMASRLPLSRLSRQHMMAASRLPYASRGFSAAGRRCVSSAALQMRAKSGLGSGSSLLQVPVSG